MPYSTKMQAMTFRWFLNILLAVIIYCNAEAGRLLGIQGLPLHFSAVWPATGISLAALLLFGYRTWPGIFAGNLIYNFLHLYLQGTSFIGPSTAALAITLGSLAQALLGAYLMRRFSTTGYFKTIRDAIIFLLAGGVLTCMIAATIGVCTLYLYGVLPAQSVLYTWLTFWFGDCMGVYTVTPLVTIWSLLKVPKVRCSRIELLLLFFAFVLTSLLFISVRYYPPAYLFIPLALWVAYRFRFHGATVAILFISIVTITTTMLDHGSFIYAYPHAPLLVLVMFLEVLVASTLFMAAVMNAGKPV